MSNRMGSIIIACVLVLCLAASSSAGSLNLSWSAPTTNADGTPLTSLAGYRVYYGTTPGTYAGVVTVGNVQTFRLNGLLDGQNYYLAVTAYDTQGDESTFSTEAIHATPPSAGYGSLRLSWAAPATNVDGTPCTDIAGYRIYYGTASGVYSSVINAGKVLSYQIDGLAGGTTYYVAVTAYDATGAESGYSNEAIHIAPAAPNYTMTANAGAGGSITPVGTTTVVSGSSQTYQISPTPGFRIADVLIDGKSSGAMSTYTFTTITANHTISASFSAITYTITASAGSGGAISPSGTLAVNSGSSQTYSVTPSAGYRIAGILVDGVSAGAIASFTFMNVAANHTIAATFAPQEFILSVVNRGTGTGSVILSPSNTICGNSCQQTFPYGTTVTLSASAGSNSSFVGWQGACTGSGVCTVTVEAALTVQALFATPSKIGLYQAGYWDLDMNGNGMWDGTTVDMLFMDFGSMAGSIPVAGDWAGDKTAKIGIYKDGTWYLDLNGNGAWDGEPTDHQLVFGAGLSNAYPVAGDWTGDGTTKIGVYAGGVWYLDLNGNGAWDGEPTDGIRKFGIGLTNAVPVAGDWTGDGTTKIGVYAGGVWYLDLNGNGQWDGDAIDSLALFGAGLTGAVPVTGVW